MRWIVILVCVALGIAQGGSAGAAAGLQNTRHASSPPVVPVGDLEFDDAVEQQLNWTYYFNGDYDQNGEVNISDVTVVGQKFNMTSQHLDWPTARVADGDGNGEVNIADLTPIGVNFGSRVTHFALYSSDDEDGPFEVDGPTQPFEHAITLFDSAAAVPGAPRQFSHHIAYPATGRYYTVVACDGDGTSAVHSNVVHFTPTNQPPRAQFNTDLAGLVLPKGKMVYFNGANSTDADGTIVNFEWDPMGNGQFISTGTEYFLDYRFDLPGEYTPVMRITDDGGATCKTSYPEPQLFIVEGTVHSQVVDSASSSGVNLSCAMIAGAPGIAYIRNTPTVDMFYVSSDGEVPPVWSSPVLVKAGASQPSLAQVANLPAIAYQKDELEFVRAADIEGNTWNTPELSVQDPSENVSRGTHPQLITVADVPVIADGAWAMLAPGEVFVTPATNNAGTSWFSSMSVNEPATTGLQPSIAEFDNEYLGIAYEKYAGPLTRYVQYRRSQTGTPYSFWDETRGVISTDCRLSYDHSLAAINTELSIFDVPLVVYWNVASATICSRLGDSYDGIVWDDFVEIGPAGETYGHFSLAIIGLQPVVVYSDRATGELLLSWAADREATGWSEPRVIDSGAEFHRPSLIDFNGRPGVAYYDSDAQVLKFCYFTLD